MAARSALDVDDVVVSKVQDGHLLWIVTPDRKRSVVAHVSRKRLECPVCRGERRQTR